MGHARRYGQVSDVSLSGKGAFMSVIIVPYHGRGKPPAAHRPTVEATGSQYGVLMMAIAVILP